MEFTGVLTEYKVIEILSNNMSKIELTFGLHKFILFASESTVLDLLNKEVSLTHTNGIVDDIVEKVYVRQEVVVNTINIDSLIPKKSSTSSNITFELDKIKPGEVEKEKVILLTAVTRNSSKVSEWIDLTCLDKYSKVFNLRLFYKDKFIADNVEALVGKYVVCSIKYDGRYGLQVVDHVVLYSEDVQVPAEVDLAYTLLSNVVSKDEDLKAFIAQYDLLNKLKTIVYGNIGYHLIEIAAEVMVLDALFKVDNTIDRRTLIRHALIRRVSHIPLKKSMNIAQDFIVYHRVISSPISKDEELLSLITGVSYLNPLYDNIKQVVRSVLMLKGFSYD